MAIALPQSAVSVAHALQRVQHFIPRAQLRFMLQAMEGEEGDFFRQRVLWLANILNTMPKTREQDGLGDQAVVHLHYFAGGFDWHITERDMEGRGTEQAFGLADMGDPELGYISIDELVACPGVELDLHWQPQTLQAVWAAKGRRG